MVQLENQYLRPKKAAALERWHQDPFEIREDLKVWRGENATILPLRREPDSGLLFGKGGVVDKDGNYVDLSSIPGRVQFSYPAQAAQIRDETVVYCGYLVHHWGHFLVEGVSRLWYFLENDTHIDKYVFFIDENEHREIRGNYREFLELLGVWDKIEIINRPTAFREVLVPELSLKCHTYYSPKFRRLFDTVAEHAVPDPSWKPLSKIYFSRSQLAKGRAFEFGFEALDNFFEKNGYTLLYPEKVPLRQMIFYIRHSDVVATLSGTLPHNMLFANQGQTVEILERCVLNIDNQVDVNRIRDLNVVSIDANIPIYTIDFGGPFIMGYNENLEQYAKDHGYVPPDGKYLTKKHFRKCFIQYMKAYEDLYHYNWFMEAWYAPFTDYLWEAYQAGHKWFGAYLDGDLPFRWYHYFEFHYWKQFVKHALVKLGLR